jgi:hypothetical protein
MGEGISRSLLVLQFTAAKRWHGAEKRRESYMGSEESRGIFLILPPHFLHALHHYPLFNCRLCQTFVLILSVSVLRDILKFPL